MGKKGKGRRRPLPCGAGLSATRREKEEGARLLAVLGRSAGRKQREERAERGGIEKRERGAGLRGLGGGEVGPSWGWSAFPLLYSFLFFFQNLFLNGSLNATNLKLKATSIK
jgi:hypothetical protein